MNKIKKKIAIVFGDKRQIFLHKILEKKYEDVKLLGFENEGTNEIFESIEQSEIIVLPIPLSRDKKSITFSNIKIDDTFLQVIKNKKIFCGGDLNFFYKTDLNVIDFLKNESFNVLNANITAQGAIKLAFEHCNGKSLKDLKILIIGFGRIGKNLAFMLKNFGTDINIAEHNNDAIWSEILGYNKINIEDSEKLDFDIFFNTADEIIFTEEITKKIKKPSTIINLATEKCISENIEEEIKKNQLKIKNFHEKGIPGRFFYKSAANVISKVIYKYI